MLTPALPWENRIHRPWTHLCEHRRSPETSGPSSPECTTPTLATVAEATPPRTGCPSCTLLRPAGRHAMVVAHFFESGQRRRLRGPSRERTANGRRSSAGQHRVHSCDRRKGLAGHVGSARASRFHSVSRHCHGDSSRAEYARRKVESSFWSGAGSQPSCGRRDRL